MPDLNKKQTLGDVSIIPFIFVRMAHKVTFAEVMTWTITKKYTYGFGLKSFLVFNQCSSVAIPFLYRIM